MPADLSSRSESSSTRLIEARCEQLLRRLRVDEKDGFLWRDELLFDQIGRDDDGCVAGPLAAARLQHEEALVLNRELEVLDVLVVALERVVMSAQLFVRFRMTCSSSRIGCASSRQRRHPRPGR